MQARRFETIGIVVSVAWATLAFGGVYTWAYAPAYLALALIGMSRIWRNRHRRDRAWKAVAAGCAIGAVVVGLQLVPLPPALAGEVSPNLAPLLAEYDLRYALAGADAGWRPLSIQPALTVRAWFCGFALGLLLLGLVAELHDDELRTITRAVLVIGVVMTVAGIVQKASGTTRVYGFWVPETGERAFFPGGGPFGPFINRNHFAGWMLLAIPLVFARLPRLLRSARDLPDVRRRVLWLQSPEGIEALVTAFGVSVMSLGLMLTASRSGIAAYLIVLAIASVVAMLKTSRPLRAVTVVAGGVVVVAAIFVRAGSDVIVTRFARASRDLAGRQRTWGDALRIFQDFPVFGTGANTYGEATLFYEPPGLEVHYVQAHNDYLQILAESGVIGVVASLLIALLIASAAWKRFSTASPTSRMVRAGAMAALCGVALQEVFDFSLQMPANAILAVVALGILLAPNDGRAGRADVREAVRSL